MIYLSFVLLGAASYSFSSYRNCGLETGCSQLWSKLWKEWRPYLHWFCCRQVCDVNRKYEHYLIPSLTLQLLVENAVKHNVVSKSSPLLIDIFTTTGNKLIVNNNLQKKTQNVVSTKIGLDNIRSKYELLNKHEFRVLEDDKNFTVVLPLIWQNTLTQKQKPKTVALSNL